MNGYNPQIPYFGQQCSAPKSPFNKLRLLRKKAQDTKDPSHHDFVRLALPYLQAIDIFADILKEKKIRAIIGGHSERAYYAYTAAALDPERIASVIFMGCERSYYRDEFPEAIKPFTTQEYVKGPIFYISGTWSGTRRT